MRYRLGKAMAEWTDSPARSVVASLFVGLCGSLVEYVTDTLVMRTSHMGPSAHAAIDASILGVCIAFLMWFVLAATRTRRQRVLEHLRVVAELNHEVRNALQVIVHTHYQADPEHAAVVMESVQRIDRTLRDLFPTMGGRRGSKPGVEVRWSGPERRTDTSESANTTMSGPGTPD